MPGPYTVPYAPRERFAPNARLVDLVRQSGQDAAESAERRGMISAQMWGNVGQSVSNAIGSYQQGKQQEAQQKALNEDRDIRRQANLLALDQAKAGAAQESRLSSALELPTRTRTLESLKSDPALYDKALKHFERMDGHAKRLMGEAAFGVRALGDNREAALIQLDDLVESAGIDPKRLAPFRMAIIEQPERISDIVDDLLKQSPDETHRAAVRQAPKLMEHDPTKEIVNAGTGAVVRPAAPKVEPTKYKETEFLLDGKRVKGSYDELTGKFLHNGVDVTSRAQDIPPQGPAPDFEWVLRAGEPKQIRKGTALPGDKPYKESAGVNPGMSSEYQTALERATMSAPAARRGAVVAAANRLWAEGNTNELAQVIKQAAIEGENVDVKNQVLGRQATLASLRDTRTILAELKAKGVPTGWLTGNIEDLARRLGKTTNPEYVTLGNRLMGTLINYRRAATGVQFSARESADYQKMFPNYRNDLPVNLALIDGLEREMTTYDKTYWEHKLGPEGSKLIGVGGDSSSRPITHRYDPDSGQPVPVSNAR